MEFRRSALLAMMTVTSSAAWGASSPLVVFDDADENGFDHNSSPYSNGMSLEQVVVHSGTTAAGVVVEDFNGASWQAPATYSTLNDYDTLSFWLHDGLPGGSGPQDLALLLYNSDDVIVGRIDLAVAYGAALPQDAWINLRIPLNGLPNPSDAPDPIRFNNITIRTYTNSGNQYFFVDDVVLIGADIFKNGFD